MTWKIILNNGLYILFLFAIISCVSWFHLPKEKGIVMKNALFFICLVLGLTSEVFARPRYYPSNNYQSKTYAYTSDVSAGGSSSDQERCQAEANYMAANNITGHVWGCIGRFEGVGYGSSPNCNTCTPSGNMTPTGDASAQGRNGMWYRVRSWR